MEPFWLFLGRVNEYGQVPVGEYAKAHGGMTFFHLFGGGICHISTVQCSQKMRSHEKGTGRQNRQKMVQWVYFEVSRNVKKCRDWNDRSRRDWGDKGG